MKAWEATVRKTQAAAKKRANTIFGTSYTVENAAEEESEEHAEEEAAMKPKGEVYQAEKFLPNGDYYTGYWSENFPHGHGKYWWTDGCMYVGDWFRGKTMGKGIFSWPSGAMYEGSFKSGFMDGEGTYTGANGTTYKGSWVMNLRHGYGVKEFSNGDVYDGEWSRGMQEGIGKYQWKSGNHYTGEWKNGKICGKGKMHWTNNGNTYEGNWADGLPKGSGKFKWSDGSFYVGNWSNDPSEQNGTYYPSGALLEGNLEWDPQEVYNDLKEFFKVCQSEKIPLWPSQKKLAVWHSSKGSDSTGGGGGGGARPRRLSVDGRIDAGLDKDLVGIRLSDGAAPSSWTADDALLTTSFQTAKLGTPAALRIPKVVKRQGETISKGHRNYELMLNLQLGIRY
ncbi:hypothetical protein M569_04775, partial [Genlisea aurea]